MGTLNQFMKERSHLNGTFVTKGLLIMRIRIDTLNQFMKKRSHSYVTYATEVLPEK